MLRSGLRSSPAFRFAVAAFGAAALAAPRIAAAQALPDRLTDQEFWQMIGQFSEPGGYFHSDNLVSNESAFQWVVPALQKNLAPGGAYLGVGPDQNFTYIIAIKPQIAFIVDIRRGDLQELLMYKALIELAPDRAAFLSLLFSQAEPPGIDTLSTPRAMFAALRTQTRPDRALYKQTLAAIKRQLTVVHGWALSAEDLTGIEYVFNAFYTDGPSLRYTAQLPTGVNATIANLPAYADLQLEVDGHGMNHAYLATEANYRALRDMESRNLIVPLTGDFAGPKALRTVGRYLADHKAIVSAIYVSNVEEYLFSQGTRWRSYYSNVATLPIDSTSVFIRSIPQGRGGPIEYAGAASSALCPVGALTKAFAAGKIHGYADMVALCR